ncbi:MAG: hypothetical protein AB1696_07920 [Planctomycetota bacterium]
MRPVAFVLAILIGALPALAQDAPPVELPRGFALIICGISGDEPHYEKFWTLGTDLYYALRDKCGYPEDRIFFLFEEKPQGQQIVRATSQKADIIKTLDELKQTLRPKDRLLIFIAGHADDENKGHTTFHLPGPDMSDEELAKLIAALPIQRITTVVTTPVSGYAMRHLAKPGRITITATKADKELSETVFPYCFVKAFEDETADQNADGLLSVLEMFRYAKEKVLDFYLEKNLICTEHPMLDDDGDGIGAREVDENAKDGKLAEQEYFEIRVKG